ncbi:MAG TPA: sigma-70 family RNA polymerase sigma factor [Kofleriaceae bacterium]|nr:sigma-70 family RNA polymerase sigma factor [Kofleriaceae bacterium]
MSARAVDLSAELDGLRALARSLVRGDVEADDLLQETAVAALEHPPATDRPVRPWLATALGNRWRMIRRAAGRRAAREAAVEAPAEPAGPDALLERARTLERVGAALVALDEPLRLVLVLRYLDGMTAAAIARQLGVPDGTIRWRLKTALDRMRATLDRDQPRGRWQRALVPGAFATGAVMKTKASFVLVALLLLLVAGGVLAVRHLGAHHPAPAAATRTAARPAATADRVAPGMRLPAPRPGAVDDTLPDPLPGQGRAVIEQVAAAAAGFRGRVINWSTGDGVAGAELTFGRDGSDDVITARSGPDGAFSVLATDGSYTLAAAEAAGFLPFAPEWGHSAVRLTARAGARVSGVTIFLFPAIDYRGLVVDAGGAPVAGAAVRLLGSPAGEQTLATVATSWTTDAHGAFVFHAPDDAVLEASARGRVGHAQLDGDVALTHTMTIRLDGDVAADGTITGVVADADGTPIEGALLHAEAVADPAGGAAAVAAAARTARAAAFATSDAAGRFVLRDLDRGRYDVSARAEDRAPAIARAVAAGADLRLTLGRGADLLGTVEDAAGAPVAAFTLLVFEVHGVERELIAARSTVDGEGRFRETVEPGAYELVASAPGLAPSAPTAARTGVPATLRLSAGAIVRGVVLRRDSKAPLANARVMREARGGGASAQPANAGTVTRDDGTFELLGVPPGPLSLFIGAGGHHPRIEAGLTAVDGGVIGPLTIALTPLAPGETPTLELVGIGVAVGPDGDALRVNAVIPGGGAADAGVLVGDHIVAVDGAPVTSTGLDGAVARLRGAAGSTVRVTFDRAGAPIELTIERKPIHS